MSNKQNTETIIGLGVIIFCIILIGVVYSKGVFGHKTQHYTLNASFERADGINVGNDVNISGVKVGEVIAKKIDETNFNALIQITIQQGLKLPIDTSAEITSASLFGDKYISLVPGAETEMLKDGDTVEFTQSSISIENLITKFFFGLDSSKTENNSSESNTQ